MRKTEILTFAVLLLCMVALADPTRTAASKSADSFAGLRGRLSDYIARATPKWPAESWRWEYVSGDTGTWHVSNHIPSVARARFSPPAPVDPAPNFSGEGECSTLVWRRFYIDADTLSFTWGRAGEVCSEAPRMIWKSYQGGRHVQPITPLYNWNVEAMWRTEHYLVFGLEADFESGTHDECLAFWHLTSGKTVLSPRMWLASKFPGWREAAAAEANGAILLARGDTIAAYWPGKRMYGIRVGRGALPTVK